MEGSPERRTQLLFYDDSQSVKFAELRLSAFLERGLRPLPTIRAVNPRLHPVDYSGAGYFRGHRSNTSALTRRNFRLFQIP